jgi:hypothetical protein
MIWVDEDLVKKNTHDLAGAVSKIYRMKKSINTSSHYSVLIIVFSFYIFAQLYQQFVLRWGPMASASGLQEMLIAGQDPLNYIRLVLILLSMFLMVAGSLILCLHFYPASPVLSILAFVFFLFFCLFEIGYRSVHLFQVTAVWGRDFAQATPEERASLLPRFQDFFGMVNAIYFPLLFSFLLASAFLFIASLKDSRSRLITAAMGIHIIQQLSRLSAYTPFAFLDVLSGIWYFPLVAAAFGLKIFWAIRLSRSAKSIL